MRRSFPLSNSGSTRKNKNVGNNHVKEVAKAYAGLSDIVEGRHDSATITGFHLRGSHPGDLKNRHDSLIGDSLDRHDSLVGDSEDRHDSLVEDIKERPDSLVEDIKDRHDSLI